MNKLLFVLFFMHCLKPPAYCQTVSLKDGLLNLTTFSDSANKKFAPEKLYLQFDKPYYAIGDTIWLKAYLFNAYLIPSGQSNMMYIDIANDSNKVIKQYRLAVQTGLAWGNISLNNKEFITGTYTIRAYTNWMRNFGGDAFFYKQIYVSNAGENILLVNSEVKTAVVNGVNTANAKLQFTDMDKNTLFAVQPLTLKVIAGTKNIYKQKIHTDVNGLINVGFKLPLKTQDNLAIMVESEQQDKKAIIPIIFNRPQNTDIQFLPEGGNLVAGLTAHIGFKAIGEDGKSVKVSGVVVDRDQNQVAVFGSLHNGMGSFNLLIKTDQVYTAKLNLPSGATKVYPLPQVKNCGTILQVVNEMESDSVEVFVSATNNIIQSKESYYLTGKARGIVCYAAIISFNNARYIKRNIAKNLFPTGITRFTLMTIKGQPLNGRLVFIDHYDKLNMQVTSDKNGYNAKDSIALQLVVTDSNGRPVAGNFSMSVSDDAQVKKDMVNDENILSRFLLTSDLKGYIEEPGYYYPTNTNTGWLALDNLLLTQGWIGYNWQQVPDLPKINYEAELKFKVSGKVTNVFNKPVSKSNILLFSKNPSFFLDTTTNNLGRFIFTRLPASDTAVYMLQARNRNDKSFNVNLDVDETPPPVFIKPLFPAIHPWYVNSDTTLLSFTKSDALAIQLKYFSQVGHVLKEVKILAKKFIKDSQNLNGSGNADVVFDEKDLEKAGKKSILQLLQERVKDFREDVLIMDGHSHHAIASDGALFSFITDGVSTDKNQLWYFVKNKPIRFIIDGTPIYKVLSMSLPAIKNINNYFTSHSAEDIKGIEVNTSSKYCLKYIPMDAVDISPADITFVEITTRSGHGPAIDYTPGTYLYKPLPFSRPEQFYKPRYTVNDINNHLKDLRSTIAWEPDIVTDANGKAKLWFYSADKSTSYTMIMEGGDLNGNIGFFSKKIYQQGNTQKHNK